MQEWDAFERTKATVTSAQCLSLIDYIDKKELFLYMDVSFVAFEVYW